MTSFIFHSKGRFTRLVVLRSTSHQLGPIKKKKEREKTEVTKNN